MGDYDARRRRSDVRDGMEAAKCKSENKVVMKQTAATGKEDKASVGAQEELKNGKKGKCGCGWEAFMKHLEEVRLDGDL